MNDVTYKRVINITCTLTNDKFAEIGRKLAAEHPHIFIELSNLNEYRELVLDVYKGLRDSDGSILNPPIEHNENFVQAIRFYRNETKLSLRESKLAVEEIVGR